MNIDWKAKLGSRKFWTLLIGIISAILIAVGFGDNQVAQITGIIGGFGTMITYILSEAYVDGQSASGDVVVTPTDTTSTNNTTSGTSN